MPRTLPMDESAKAMQARLDYLQLGPGRSVTKLADKYKRELSEGISVPTTSRITLEKWSAAHHWIDFVLENMAKEREAVEFESEERRKAWAKSRLDEAHALHVVAAKLLFQINQLIERGDHLNLPLGDVDVVVPFVTVTEGKVNKDGRELPPVTVTSSRVIRKRGLLS